MDNGQVLYRFVYSGTVSKVHYRLEDAVVIMIRKEVGEKMHGASIVAGIIRVLSDEQKEKLLLLHNNWKRAVVKDISKVKIGKV